MSSLLKQGTVLATGTGTGYSLIVAATFDRQNSNRLVLKCFRRDARLQGSLQAKEGRPSEGKARRPKRYQRMNGQQREHEALSPNNGDLGGGGELDMERAWYLEIELIKQGGRVVLGREEF